MGTLTRLFTLAALLFGAMPALADEKIALVLSGGGARGGAHIGVLRALEAENIKPDLIVGVSFGALVGSLYAAGMDVDSIESKLASLNLAKNLQDRPSRDQMNSRQKRNFAGNLLNFDIGVGREGVKLPLGLLQGQELSVQLASAFLPVANEYRFAQLPIPFVAVATDLVSGEAVRLDRGNLATAVQASLAVPVVFAPVEIDGRLLVDGGVANNLPVDVARDLGATRVIAVDASMPRYQSQDLDSFVSVVDQITTLLTRANADRQLARLGPRDVLISPELGDIGSLELDRIGEAAEAGQNAAVLQLPASIPQLSSDDFSQWQTMRMARYARPQQVDSLTVFNGSRMNGRVIVNQLASQPGQVLEAEQLSADLRRIYAIGIFDRVEAAVVEDGNGARSLDIRTSEKNWGPDYLNFGAGIEDNFRGDSAYSFRLSYTATGQNPTGGELKTTLELGEAPSLTTQFYQPIGYGSPWFAELELKAQRRKLKIFEDSKPIAEYLVENSGIGFDIGRKMANWGEIRVGLNRGRPRSSLELGQPVLDSAGDEASVETRLSVDTLDSLGFPSTGAHIELTHISSQAKLGADTNYETGSLLALAPYTGRFGTLMARAELGRVLNDGAPPERAFTLGGFGRLSGYSPGELAGSELTLISLLGYQPMASGFGLGQMYRGFSLEAGNVFIEGGDTRYSDLLAGGSFFVGLDSQLGPLYLSFGASEGGRRSVSLTLGKALGE